MGYRSKKNKNCMVDNEITPKNHRSNCVFGASSMVTHGNYRCVFIPGLRSSGHRSGLLPQLQFQVWIIALVIEPLDRRQGTLKIAVLQTDWQLAKGYPPKKIIF